MGRVVHTVTDGSRKAWRLYCTTTGEYAGEPIEDESAFVAFVAEHEGITREQAQAFFERGFAPSFEKHGEHPWIRGVAAGGG